ncbi:hypothetical protein MGG_17666 [Pyricularia oryzae 70-15]|uniref:Hydrophobin n=1 Tax=Pyricularia oryzae (strain 70-15 / ATCC MYA-4617 / FGSC 8958) TaxID=242507 RepID=G4NFB1_PYRO7|nr:uncharacterized protein MGG_17666 [Pyricularia oryzae 70-15]EHA47205.1 hypothetical protein MGG_17666 [Pyricularia oryzae 70-15]
MKLLIFQLLSALLAHTILSAPTTWPGKSLPCTKQSPGLAIQDPSRLSPEQPREPVDRRRPVDAKDTQSERGYSFTEWIGKIAGARNAALAGASCFCGGGTICCRDQKGAVGGLSCGLGVCSV